MLVASIGSFSLITKLQLRTTSCPNFIPTISAAAKSMSTSTTNSNHGGAFTTIREIVTFEKEIKRSKFIAIAGRISDERSAATFLSEVRDPKATHNCWAYKIGDQYRTNDDGEPPGTAGKPIYTAIVSSGLDRVMVVVIRNFGGIKLGTGGLVRAYGGAASECLRIAETCLIKSKVRMGIEIPYDLLGVLYHQLQSFQVEDINQDYDTGKGDTTMVTFKVNYDQVEGLEDAVKSNCSHHVVFYKHWQIHSISAQDVLPPHSLGELPIKAVQQVSQDICKGIRPHGYPRSDPAARRKWNELKMATFEIYITVLKPLWVKLVWISPVGRVSPH